MVKEKIFEIADNYIDLYNWMIPNGRLSMDPADEYEDRPSFDIIPGFAYIMYAFIWHPDPEMSFKMFQVWESEYEDKTLWLFSQDLVEDFVCNTKERYNGVFDSGANIKSAFDESLNSINQFSIATIRKHYGSLAEEYIEYKIKRL